MISKDPRQSARKPRRFALVAALALIAGTVSIPLPASAATDSEVESSILLVGTTWSGYIHVPASASADGDSYWTDKVTAFSFCTGWFVSTEGHIMTAGHCVDPSEGRIALLTTYLSSQKATDLLDDAIVNWPVEGENSGDPVNRVVQVVQPDNVPGAIITGKPLTAQIVTFRSFKDGDVTLLHVAGLKKTPPLAVAHVHPQIGDSLTAIGFPASVQKVADGARIRASFKSGTASSQQFTSDGVAGTEVNADISPGMSGGPTVNSKGEVLGINSYTINGETQNFNFITDTADLESFLKSNNVPYVPAPVDNGLGWIWIVVIVVVVILIVAAVVWFLVFRKKDKTKPVAAPPVQGQWTQPPPPSPSAMPIFVAPPQPAPAPPLVDVPAQETVELFQPPEEAVAPTTVTCSKCGSSYPVGTKYCSNDGTPLTNT